MQPCVICGPKNTALPKWSRFCSCFGHVVLFLLIVLIVRAFQSIVFAGNASPFAGSASAGVFPAAAGCCRTGASRGSGHRRETRTVLALEPSTNDSAMFRVDRLSSSLFAIHILVRSCHWEFDLQCSVHFCTVPRAERMRFLPRRRPRASRRATRWRSVGEGLALCVSCTQLFWRTVAANCLRGLPRVRREQCCDFRRSSASSAPLK